MQIAADLELLAQRYRETRARTRQIFGLLAPEAFSQRPIPLRHPIRFYEGHLASFNFGMLQQSGFIEWDPEPELTALFARGIDPLDVTSATSASIHQWPERAVVRDYVERVEQRMEEAFEEGVEPLHLFTAVEHEEMHQETLTYLIHRLPHELKHAPEAASIVAEKTAGETKWQRVPGGAVKMGADSRVVAFGWDNEFPQVTTEVQPFEVQTRKVSNGDYLRFVEDGGYEHREWWSSAAWQHLRGQSLDAPPYWERRDGGWSQRALFKDLPLPLDWPVYVSHIEAQAYARWSGSRLLTEPEWHRASEVAAAPKAERDNLDFVKWNPTSVGSGVGLDQLTGNGWEWTSTVFAGFPGFAPFPHYPGYSADFFDGRHFVLKGASPVTPAALARPSFRNWFQDQYRHAYTAFRCARDA